MRWQIPVVVVIAPVCIGLLGCGSQGTTDVCDLAAPQCPEGLVCNAVLDGDPSCFAPIAIHGTVVDATTEEPIAGALVQAVDVNGAAVGTSGQTDENGEYTLLVPAVRDLEGVPVDGAYTLRAQAAGYQAFPTAIRPALPLDAASAILIDGTWTIDQTLTIIKLLPIEGDVASLGSISGVVDSDFNAGILIVADGVAGAFTGFSDADGVYTIFNVPAGSYTVDGYAAGVQLASADALLGVGEQVGDVDLLESDNALSTVSGNVQIVNAPGGSITSVILAVESTFVEDAARGAVPPGLRAADVTSDFTISGVPDGRYVVLAAFENDNLVRDPDQTIGGTSIVTLEVPDPVTGNIVDLPEGFKVTEALAVVSPGSSGPEVIDTLTPTFVWQDDSSEDGYTVRVFDAFGNEIWNDEIGPVTGSESVSHAYAGPALEPGMFYQFRATSFRDKNGVRTSISATEDLKGVFQVVMAP